MKTPLVDLVAQYQTIQDEIDDAVRRVLRAGQFILGPNVAALEQEVSSFLGVDRGVGVASGTDALVLALRALEIGPGDEVIVPAYTFFATAGAVMLVGARPVFADVEPDTYCLDVQQVAERITGRTRAVIPVHLYGHPCDMAPLLELAGADGLKVIEDNAQAIGAEYRGRKTGSFGDVGCLSFYPSKNLGAYGDAGMVVSDDRDTAERVQILRSHGWQRKYEPEVLGYNSRLDELQAAVLLIKLRYLERWNERRRELAWQYTEQLAGTEVGVPSEAPGAKHVYHLYVIRVDLRARVQERLQQAGIASAVYYPRPVHLTQSCKSLGFVEGDFPVAERASKETLAIPLYPEMTGAQVDEVAEVIRDAVRRD